LPINTQHPGFNPTKFLGSIGVQKPHYRQFVSDLQKIQRQDSRIRTFCVSNRVSWR